MNTDNLGVTGPGVGSLNDPYSHHHLTQHHHLLPPHHSQHPASMYCSSSNPYAEFFPPFPTDFVAAHDAATNSGVHADYLTLQNSLEYVVSHHHHHQQQQQQQQLPSHHHHHQISGSSNRERTPSSVGNGINGSDSSPSHSFGTSSGYSSSVDYYNTPVLTSKTSGNNTNASNTNSNNNNHAGTTTNTSNHSPYDGTSTASTSSPPRSTGYLTAAVKQETMMPPAFAIDSHTSYSGMDLSLSICRNSPYLLLSPAGNVNGIPSSANAGSNGNVNNNTSTFGLNVDDYGSSLYHPSATSTYPSYSPSSLLQTSYPVGPYGVPHSDHMRLYSSQLKHDFG
jgi:hypothetical protein